jgi:hypothetical protein
LCQVRRDKTAKREAGQIDGRIGTEQRIAAAVERIDESVQAVRRMRIAGQRVGIPEARHVGNEHRVACCGQSVDVANPMEPAAMTAMQQHQWHTRAEAPPGDAAAARLDPIELRSMCQ